MQPPVRLWRRLFPVPFDGTAQNQAPGLGVDTFLALLNSCDGGCLDVHRGQFGFALGRDGYRAASARMGDHGALLFSLHKGRQTLHVALALGAAQ